jgi:hypothetical protein
MKPQIDFVKAYSRARRNAWAKLNNGDPEAKLPAQDPRHDLHARIMDRLHARVLLAIRKRQSRKAEQIGRNEPSNEGKAEFRDRTFHFHDPFTGALPVPELCSVALQDPATFRRPAGRNPVEILRV